ncbi:MAG: hypothetical protein CMI26_13260 [Opitutae bacterium]|nr:hypothetical protein [Opitutae bacterium]|tara:strand:- start:1477 stop:2274 length:798 start_codon:yes stop_codon:yes gene_type:complete
MPPSPSSPWEALRAGFRRACVRRLVGDEEGAIAVLRDEIPGLVVGWAKTSSLEAPEKKAKLKEVFDDESGRADELAVAFDLFAARFETKVADHVSREVKKARAELVAVSNKIEEALANFSRRIDALPSISQITLPGPVAESLPIEDEATTEESKPSKPEIEIEEEPAPEPASIEVTPESETKPAEPEFQDVAENELPQAPKPEPEPAEEPEPEPVPTAKPKKEPMQEPDTDSEAETIAETSPVIPRGIRFDDIEGMIDELLAEEE